MLTSGPEDDPPNYSGISDNITKKSLPVIL